MMAWSCLCTSSTLWLVSCVNLLLKSDNFSLSGVPVTLSCVLSIFTCMSPLSSTTGSPLVSLRKMVPTRTESMDPSNWNCPCTTSHESRFFRVVSLNTFRYNFCPSSVDTFDVPLMLKVLAQEVKAIRLAMAYKTLFI